MAIYPQAAIEARGLTVIRKKRVVLNRVDLQISAGQLVVLLGANGAGKTTLLQCFAGLLRPAAGDVLWFGRPARSDVQARRLLGLVAHERFLYKALTPRENLLFAATLCDVAQPNHRVQQLLDHMGLSRQADRLTSTLSHGMQQRLSLARAMVHNPRILLLDEPFAGLDTAGQGWLHDWLRRLRACGITVCLATHDPSWAQQWADRVLRVGGRRVHDEPLETPGSAQSSQTRSRAA